MSRQSAIIPGLGYAPSGRKLDVDVFPFSDIRRRLPAAKVRATHRYDFHLLLLVTKGISTQMVDFEPVSCSPGSLLVLRPGQVHSFGADPDWEGWLVMFRAEFLPSGSEVHTDLLPGRMLDHMPDHQVLDEAQLRTTAEAIITMATDARADLANIEVIHTLLRYQLCTLILRLQILGDVTTTDAGQHTSAQRRFEKFRDLLDANFSGWHQIGPYTNALGCCRVVSNYGSLRVDRCFSKFVDLNYGSQARPALRIALCLQMKRLATCDRLCRPQRPTTAALCCRL